jgi:hypothetical protein
MRVSTSIFDSKAEREAFLALESRWSPRIRPYPQLPLAKLVKLDAGDKLTGGQRRFFYATNVDYTFCVDDGRPLFSVEFDGIGGGYSSNGKYRQARSTDDPHRQLKMDFKLRVSNQVGYPLVVVSFDELQALDGKESLTILDGIVAQFVTRREEDALFKELVDDQADMIEQLAGSERDEYMEDLVLQAGVLAELEHDPIVIARMEAQQEAGRFDLSRHRKEWVFDPPLPDLSGGWPPSVESFEARIDGWAKAERVGVRAEVPTPLGTVVKTVWLRNVGHGSGLTPHLIAEEVALMLAFRSAVAIMGEHFEPKAPRRSNTL